MATLRPPLNWKFFFLTPQICLEKKHTHHRCRFIIVVTLFRVFSRLFTTPRQEVSTASTNVNTSSFNMDGQVNGEVKCIESQATM